MISMMPPKLHVPLWLHSLYFLTQELWLEKILEYMKAEGQS